MGKVILASSSKNRKALMDILSIPYEVMPADIDEKAIRYPDFAKQAQEIAKAKAEKIAAEFPDAIVIAGDSFGAINGKAYEKPKDSAEARQMLLEQSGKDGVLYVGFCYIDPAKHTKYSTVVTTTFAFREFSATEIDAYIQKNPVLTWSGAMNPAELYGASFVKYLEGSMTGFMLGFPAEELIPCLLESGFAVHP